MKKRNKKLTLERESFRHLDLEEVGMAQGGSFPSADPASLLTLCGPDGQRPGVVGPGMTMDSARTGRNPRTNEE